MLRKIKSNQMRNGILFALAVTMLLGFSSPLQAGNKSIVKVGSDVHVDEDVRIEDAVAIGGSVYIDGIVDQDAVAVGGSVHLGETAVIHGDVVTVGGSIEKTDGAIIYGSTVDVSAVNLENIFDNMDFSPQLHRIPSGFKFIPVIGLIALAMLFAVIMPKELNKIATVAKNEPVIMFLWGLLGVILIIPLALMLLISIVGIALIPLEILAVFLASLIGYVAVSVLIGRRVLRAMKNDDPNIVLSALIGILLLWLVGLIPFFGTLVKIIACTVGFGAVIIAIARRNRKEDELTIAEEK